MTMNRTEQLQAVLDGLLAWEEYMGGFDAPIWEQAHKVAEGNHEFINELNKRPMSRINSTSCGKIRVILAMEMHIIQCFQ